MKTIHCEIPGKTFLVGEYSALVGGAGIGLSTRPYFKVSIELKKENHYPSFKDSLQEPDLNLIKLAKQSAAGRWLIKKNIDSEQLNIHFTNQYGVGGFGASTAEFIAAYLFSLENEKSELKTSTKKDSHLFTQDIFTQYRELYTGDNQIPSGADLLTQLHGPITLFDLANSQNVKYEALQQWPFESIKFDLYSTGLKIKTHEHLQNLDRSHLLDLNELSREVVHYFREDCEYDFLKQMQRWTTALKNKQLTHHDVVQIKHEIESQFSSLLVKPCGALGADVIAVLGTRSDLNKLRNYFEQNKGKLSDLLQPLKLQASDESLGRMHIMVEP